MDDTQLKEKERLKAKLSKWEKRFSDKHGRRPTRSDVDRVAEVAYTYRQYADLKAKLATAKAAKVTTEQPLTPSKRLAMARAAENAFKSACSSSAKKRKKNVTPIHQRSTCSPLKQTTSPSRSNQRNPPNTLPTLGCLDEDSDKDDAINHNLKPVRLFSAASAPKAFGSHLNKGREPEHVERPFKDTGISMDSDPEDENITSTNALKKLLAPIAKKKSFKDSMLSANLSSSADMDPSRMKAAEAAVQKYLESKFIVQPAEATNAKSSKPEVPSKFNSFDSGSLGSVLPASQIPTASATESNPAPDALKIIAPGAFSLRSRQTTLKRNGSKTVFNLSSSFLQSPIKCAESMFVEPEAQELRQDPDDAMPDMDSHFESGWANNTDEPILSDALHRRKPRAKKMANGMKMTKALQVADREAKKAAALTREKISANSENVPSKLVERKRKRVEIVDESDVDDLQLSNSVDIPEVSSTRRVTRQKQLETTPLNVAEPIISAKPANNRRVILESEGDESEDDDFKNEGFDESDFDTDEHFEEDVNQRMDGAEPTSRQLQPKKVAKPKSAKSAEPKKAAPRVKLTASKAGVSKSDGWGKAEDRSVRDHTGAIGSSNFRSLNLQKSKFGKGGARNAGFKGKGRFGGSSYGTKLKSYSYKSSGGFSNENPWTACIDDAVEAIHSDVERKRLLALPDFDFERFGDAHEIDEEIAAVSPSYFDEDALSQFPTQRFVDLNSALKSLTGLESFREGQVKTIKRILNGESTILVLPTGGGKSLCYQLPAYVLRILSKNKQSCLCLVISPMVSLMQDQMRCLPPKLKGACLSSNQSASEYKATMDALNSDEIDILYVTPEKLQTESFQTFVHQQRLSKIRFVCIDEAHCLTEWSHNFRTSYLSLNTVVEEVLGRPCVLGLTATATLQARKACVDMLGLEAGMGAVVAESRMRENLKLSVSKVNSTDNRDMLLENLLKSDAFAGLNSIIVYTMFQNQADNVAKYLRTRNFDADSYHAGKPHLERAILQQKFMSNRLRILVATVAFGLGINKPDVRSVIHYNLPKSLENYMQECGRSGRDGLPALCHVFLSTEDYVRHRSFAYSEGVDEASVWKFVLRVFGEKKKATANSKSTKEGSRVGTIQGRRTMIIPIEETESELDMKESVLATLLTYMEGFEDKPIRVFPAIYGSFSVHFNKQSAFDLADTNPVLAAILKNSQKTKGKLVVDALSVCSDADVSPSVLNMTLMDLKRKKEIHFEGLERAFHIELVNAVMTQKDDEYLDRMRLLLTSKMRNLETSRVAKLDVLYEALLNASVDSIDDIIWDADVPMDEADLSPDAIQLLEEAQRRMSTLKNTVHEYFETETGTLETFESQSSENEVGSEDACLLGVKEGFRDPNLAERSNKCKKILRIDLTDFIVQNSAVFTSGRAIARIFHGISSPKFPAYDWYKNKAWNSYSHFSFGELVKMASKALMEFRMRSSKSEQNMDE